MPPNRNSSAPPKVLTWKAATPTLAVALIFDALRAFFEMFWFFGPALAAIGCTALSNGFFKTAITTIGGKVAAGVCGGAAAVAGFFAAPAIETFGLLMADFISFFGFLVLVTWVVISNWRIVKTVKTAPFQFAGAFVMSEIPFIGAFPFFFITLWRLYSRQIKVEKEALNKWNTENAAAIAEEQRMNAQIQIQQIQEAQDAEFETEEAANDGADETDEEETPNHTKLAA
jgi:hypothetical protein